ALAHTEHRGRLSHRRLGIDDVMGDVDHAFPDVIPHRLAPSPVLVHVYVGQESLCRAIMAGELGRCHRAQRVAPDFSGFDRRASTRSPPGAGSTGSAESTESAESTGSTGICGRAVGQRVGSVVTSTSLLPTREVGSTASPPW